MNIDQLTITKSALKNTIDTINLIEASLQSYVPFDSKKAYTAKEREPYDALCDRFIRGVETIRDLLNKMEKLNLIDSTILWMKMRDIRNRIVHDYLPETVEKIYTEIAGAYGKEMLGVKGKITNLELLK